MSYGLWLDCRFCLISSGDIMKMEKWIGSDFFLFLFAKETLVCCCFGCTLWEEECAGLATCVMDPKMWI
ncbi:hypothetical protein L6452_06819 [Arctium lappa]|uniref:Uncharacterized protein n=1 Tax=Arctium lappa TaxID=4217 RepID=A0ACB9EKN7_ARCLA|nr:hypothetical protein L6452_06819 [Arctium lappa]